MLFSCIELKPLEAEGHFMMGSVLAEQGKLEEALAAYEEGLRLEPGNPILLRRSGICILRWDAMRMPWTYIGSH